MKALRDNKARGLNKILRKDLRALSKKSKYAKRLAKAQGTFKDGVGTYKKKNLFGKLRTTTIDTTGKALKKNMFKQGYTGLTKYLGMRRNDGSMKSFKKGFKSRIGKMTLRKDGKRRNPFSYFRRKGKKNKSRK